MRQKPGGRARTKFGGCAPLLRLYKFKAQRRLLLIGMAELSFDFQQAELFLNQRHHLQLDALKGGRDKPGLIGNFCEQTANTGRCLYEEVGWDQSEEIKTFLLCTSFIKQLGPGICNAAGAELRHHPLFAGLLQRKLRDDYPDWLAGLHQRAADWFLQAGDPDGAIEHALTAGADVNSS
ncbi:hypothetical protein [Roseateles sp.]|uniref:hypothetical protein n=1 Tax=Roseateles sp. TaxID=1971397 RepID=UPI00286CD359|nr:hypothetical protein [Roseateles sp.]